MEAIDDQLEDLEFWRQQLMSSNGASGLFTGEDEIRIHARNLGEDEIEEIVENALDRIGRVRFGKHGSFEVSGRRFENSFATTEIHGQLSPGCNGKRWLFVKFEVKPTALCWVIAVVGIIFSFLGVLILLIPNSTKNDVQRVVANAVRDARDDVEDYEGRAQPAG